MLRGSFEPSGGPKVSAMTKPSVIIRSSSDWHAGRDVSKQTPARQAVMTLWLSGIGLYGELSHRNADGSRFGHYAYSERRLRENNHATAVEG